LLRSWDIFHAVTTKSIAFIPAPESNFSFQGKATSDYAFFGTEVNGYYYMQAR